MTWCTASWGPPEYGPVFERAALIERLASAGLRLRVLAASSGSGKSFLAAQYAMQHSGPVLWIDAGATALSAATVLSAVLDRLNSERQRPVLPGPPVEASTEVLAQRVAEAAWGRGLGRSTPLLVILDDWAPVPETGSCEVLALATFFRNCNIALMLTTRSRIANIRFPSDALVLDAAELRITRDEAEAVLGDSALAARLPDLERLLTVSDGHAGLFFLLSRQSPDNHCWSESLTDLVTRWFSRPELGLFSDHALRCLRLASMLRRGTSADLESLGVRDAGIQLLELASRFPLIRVSRLGGRSGDVGFDVHDAARLALLGPGADPEPETTMSVAHILGARGDYAIAIDLMYGAVPSREVADWIERYAAQSLDRNLSTALISLLERCPAQLVLERPSLVMCWANCLLLSGAADEAAAKARAAYRLALQSGDHVVAVESKLVLLHALAQADEQELRAQEAASLLEMLPVGLPDSIVARAHLAASSCFACAGGLEEAENSVVAARGHLTGRSNTADVCEVEMRTAAIRALGRGLYREAVGLIGSTLARRASVVSDRVAWRGNLAMCLLECGRLERAAPLAAYAVSMGTDYDRSAFRMISSAVAIGLGDTESFNREMQLAIESSIRIEHDSDLAANRVYFAVSLRSLGRLDESLSAAERAYEVLCGLNYLGFRQLAVIEVAASLVALGDPSGALRWLQELNPEALQRNQYHGLRAAMVTAECDRLGGRVESAIHALANYGPHVLSESSNWQIAMYCRAFPHLLGMFATALGSDQLPVHMLRMILPEYAERSLEAAMGWMEQSEWERLGVRLLGEEQFEQLKRRSGKPLCHVRMFGGLEVTIGQKVIGERDWGKRKARLLFAMIAARRGSDVPREQILDQLWPDLEPERARNNFYVVWSTMKAALTPEGETPGRTCPYVESFRGRCRITRSAVRMDLDDFEIAQADLRAAEEGADVEAVLDALRRISAAYRGDFLPGDVYEECFGPLRDSYRFDFLSAMNRGTAKLIALGEPAEALVFARRGLQVDPTREDLYQLALRAHIDSGQRSAAIETFLQCRAQLVDELGLDPSAETIALYEEILAMEERTDFDSAGLAG